MTPQITGGGLNLMLRGLAGDTIKFVSFALGNGAEQDPDGAEALSNHLMELPLTADVAVSGSYATLTATFSNSTVETGFRFTELGVYAQDPDDESKKILYAYGYDADETADYIAAATDKVLETQLDYLVYVGAVENIAAVINSSLVYATADQLTAHTSSQDNPHKVTAEQAGAAALNHTHAFESITARPSTYPPSAHSHTFGSITGKPDTYPPSHDRRAARAVIGSSGAGYTAADCDYLCDGTDDQAEINAAVAGMSATGGRILLLDGTYNITANIAVNKSGLELCGSASCKLIFTNDACIKITADGCSVHGLTLAGTKTTLTGPVLLAQNCAKPEIYSLRVSKGTVQIDTCTNAIVRDNFIGENNGYNWGIRMNSGSHNTVTGNNLTGAYYGIHAAGEKMLTVSQNTTGSFNECGVCADSCEDVLISGNNLYTATGGGIVGIVCQSCARVSISGNSINMAQDSSDTFACISVSGTSKSTVNGNILRDISANPVIEITSCTDMLLLGNVMVSDYATKINVSGGSGITNTNNYGYGL